MKSETALLEGRRDPQEVFYPYEPRVPQTQYMLQKRRPTSKYIFGMEWKGMVPSSQPE